MRRSVDIIIDMLGSGITADQIIEDHTELKKEDIPASLNCEYLDSSLMIGPFNWSGKSSKSHKWNIK